MTLETQRHVLALIFVARRTLAVEMILCDCDTLSPSSMQLRTNGWLSMTTNDSAL